MPARPTRSTRASDCGAPPPGSSRASVRSCCTTWLARTRPRFRSATAATRLASLPARSIKDACSCSAVNGVRISCAASAMKARCAASAALRRFSRSLSASISGRASTGTPASGSGSSCTALRDFTSRAMRSSCASPMPTVHQISAPSTGSSTRKGITVRHAAVAAASLRTRVGCATCTT